MREDPGEHGGRRGFAVRTRYGKHMPALENVFAHPLRSGRIRETRIENRFKERIAARNGIAHNPEIGLYGKLINAVAFNQSDTRRFERVASSADRRSCRTP